MRKKEIEYCLTELTGLTDFSDFVSLDNGVLYISFSDATKTKNMDTLNQFKIDSSNGVLVQRRLRKDGKVICYPGTETPCYNVYTFESIINIGRKPIGG